MTFLYFTFIPSIPSKDGKFGKFISSLIFLKEHNLKGIYLNFSSLAVWFCHCCLDSSELSFQLRFLLEQHGQLLYRLNQQSAGNSNHNPLESSSSPASFMALLHPAHPTLGVGVCFYFSKYLFRQFNELCKITLCVFICNYYGVGVHPHPLCTMYTGPLGWVRVFILF